MSRIRRNQRAPTNITTESETRPTIVFTFTQTNIDYDKSIQVPYWGLGDSIRGIISVYKLCKRNRYNFLLDINNHPFSQFLEKDTTPYHCISGYYKTQYAKDYRALETVKQTVKRENICYVYSTVWPATLILQDEKNLICRMLTIKKEYIIELPASYSVIHIRTGDDYINADLPDTTLTFYAGLIKKYMRSDKIVFCSDNVQLKRHIATTMPDVTVFVNDARSGHVGYDTDPGMLQNTLNDLQIIMGAHAVYTYSVYEWVSNFVYWVTQCFDIPLIDMKVVG